jgi:hypothetical protein
MPVQVVLDRAEITVDLILQDAPINPPPVIGSDSGVINGTVTVMPDCPDNMACIQVMQVVPQCTVIISPMYVPMMYPLPPEYEPRTAVTDESGNFAITVLSGSYFVTAAKAGLGFAEAQAEVGAAETVSVALALSDGTEPPITPDGVADIEGTVSEVYDPLENDGMTATQPVAGCTVIVCTAVMPFLYEDGSIGASDAGTSAPDDGSVLDRNQFMVITDQQGRYSLNDIPTYGPAYTVIVMAQMGSRFGMTSVILEAGATAIADIIIYDATVTVYDGTVTDSANTDPAVVEPNVYQEYYQKLARELVPQNSSAITAHISHATPANGSLRVSGNTLILKVPAAQNITIRALTLNGRVIATLAGNRPFSAGIHRLPVGITHAGPVLIQVRGESVSFIAEVNSLMRHR